MTPAAPPCAVCAEPADHVLHAGTVRHQRGDVEHVVPPRPWALCGCCAGAVVTGRRAASLRRVDHLAGVAGSDDLGSAVGDAWNLLVALGQQAGWGRAPRPTAWRGGVPSPRGAGVPAAVTRPAGPPRATPRSR